MKFPGDLNLGKVAQNVLRDAKEVVDNVQQGTSQVLAAAQKEAEHTMAKSQQVSRNVSEGLAKSANNTGSMVAGAWNKFSNLPNLQLSNGSLTTRTLSIWNTLGFQFTKFIHHALTSDGGIRLVRILNAEYRSDIDQSLVIRCEMQQFNPVDCPSYNALSYSWGPPPDSTPIIINGGVCRIRQNLFEFLRLTRRESSISDYYWIDALCINQDDVDERNKAVRKMKDIYVKARRVIIWLGSGDETVEKSFCALDSITRAHDLDIFDSSVVPMVRHKPAPETIQSDSVELINLKKIILEHQYWSRGWILQEASTPPFANGVLSQTEVCLGKQRRLLEEFILAQELLDIKDRPKSQVYGLRVKTPFRRLTALREFRKGDGRFPPIDLMTLLDNARACQVTDPHDKVYALLAIAVDGKDFEVDYSKSVVQTYQDIARAFILRDKNLNILGFANGRRKLDGLPSWTPDWTEGNIAEPFPKRRWERKDGNWKPSPVYDVTKGAEINTDILDNSRFLTMSGFIFDKISLSCDIWEFLAADGGPSASYVCGGTRIEAFRHIITADVNIANNTFHVKRGAAAPWPEYVDSQDAWVATQNSVISVGGSKQDFFELLPCLDLVGGAFLNRTLIRTEKGFMGIAADTAKVADLVCIIRGAQVPLVLRRQDSESFVFSGECYLHGIMDGEELTDKYALEERAFNVQ